MFQPVEIRLIRGLDGWLFDYVTDFSYQGGGSGLPSFARSSISTSWMTSTICRAGDRYLAWKPRTVRPVGSAISLATPSLGYFHRHGQRGVGGVMTNELPLSHYSTPVAGAGRRQDQATANSPGRALVAAPHSWQPKRSYCHTASALVWRAVATALSYQCRGLAHHEPADKMKSVWTPTRCCFWRSQAGPVPLSEHPVYLALFERPAASLHLSRLWRGE